MENEIIEIYIDASVRGNKACIAGKVKKIMQNGEERFWDLFSQDIYTDKSSKAEILACARSLEEADKQGLVNNSTNVIIYSDFQPLVDGYQTMGYWIGKGFSLKSSEFIVDINEWNKIKKQREIYYKKYKIYPVVKKVIAHSNNLYNNSVDSMAKMVVRQPGYQNPKPTQILSKATQNRILRQSNQPRGTVNIFGQKIPIRILNCEYLKKKIWMYKYEFYSNEKMLWISSEHKVYSRLSLDCGKIYFVKIIKDKNKPLILDAEVVSK